MINRGNNIITFESHKMLPSDDRILAGQNIPVGAEVPEKVLELIEEGKALYLEYAVPKGIISEISKVEFQHLFEGSGLNEIDPVLESIYQQADHLTMFVLTSGVEVCDMIEKYYQKNDMATGYILDLITSLATDGLVTEIELTYHVVNSGRLSDGFRTLSYSPGYCGWHISAQKYIFDFLDTQSIGVSLTESFLMTPIKSVSGVLVTGRKEIHFFDECSFNYCLDCKTLSCRERMDNL